MTTRSLRTVCGAFLTSFGLLAILGSGPAFAAPAPVGLGTAGAFAVMGASTVTNTGPSVISGSLGVSPGTAVTGFPPGLVLNGTIHAADATAAQAQQDIITAYNDVASRAVTATVTADLAGQTLLPGVYDGGTLSLTGTLTLDAQGDADAVFILRASSTLITSSASTVLLTPGTNPCGVFWLVGSSATLGTGSDFVGTVLAQTAITSGTGTDVAGRLFARTAAVTLDNTKVTLPNCLVSVSPSASPTSAPSATPAPTGTATPTASPAPTGGTAPTGTAAPTATVAPTGTITLPPSSSVTPTLPDLPTGPNIAGTSAREFGPGPLPPSTVISGTVPVPGAPVAIPANPRTGLPLTGASIGETVLLGFLLAGLGVMLCLSSTLRSRRR